MLAVLALVVGLIGSAASVVLRFRRARGEQRQQMKWIAYAGAVAAVSIVVMVPLYEVVGERVANATMMVSIIGLPVATAVAILRYRLYDIDVVINRTLVYGSLTATLAGVYVGSVLLLQLALSGLTEGSGPRGRSIHPGGRGPVPPGAGSDPDGWSIAASSAAVTTRRRRSSLRRAAA